MGSEMTKEIRSTVTDDGSIELSIARVEKPVPKEGEVLIRVEAAPINPSDLGLLISFAADLDTLKVSGSGDDTVTSMKIHEQFMRTMTARVGQSMPAGNEGSGVVEAAGEGAAGLVGKTVGVAGGGMYAGYRCLAAKNCLVMEAGTTPAQAASSFVNPLTALGFVETMKLENHSALVHTAAASNLGQMLVKICRDANVPLVNIVRKSEQVDLLKNLGAEYVCNTSDENFMPSLIEALVATGATLGFDATGGGNGGKLVGQILSGMEVAANKAAGEYSRYGSDTHKQVYIYGGLDPTPTVLNRAYGMQWGLGGWLLTPMIGRFGMPTFQQMRQRVASEIHTTFASHYSRHISFQEMLQPEIIRAYARQATGEKFLVEPHRD